VEVSLRQFPSPFLSLLLALFFCFVAIPASLSAQETRNSSAGQNSAGAAPQKVKENSMSSQTPPTVNAASKDTAPSTGSSKAETLASEPRAAESLASNPSSHTGLATLKVCLRMEDDAAFGGLATIHVMPSEGYELNGTSTESEGEMLFSNLVAGAYSVEVNAPGFLTLRQKIQIEPGNHLRTLFVVMKTKALPSSATEPVSAALVAAPLAEAGTDPASWLPPGIDVLVPEVQPDVECSLPQILKGAGARMTQLINNLQKFSATEHVDHFTVDVTGARHGPDARTFDYVVLISPGNGGFFALDEYRNGRVDPNQFPARVATEGLSAMALVFHPLLVSEFNFSCEGLGRWNGHPAWQVHFSQRLDRPNRIRAYVIGGQTFSVPIKGRAWIDAGSYQVLRLESELMKPIQDIGLTHEYIAIDYGPVKFRTHNQQLWLPLDAEVYAERRGHRYYRRHAFSDFKIFTVDTDQSIHAPKESYCFTNTTDHDIAGILTVSPVSGISLKAVSIQFLIPPGQSVYKVVGPGKDISMPVEEVGSATFVHNGPAGSIKADAYLVKESTLDVIADSPMSVNP